MEIDRIKLKYTLDQFVSFVNFMDQAKNESISFSENSGFLGNEEYYKTRAATNAWGVLKSKKWDERWIGSGKIAECAISVMKCAENLVHYNQKTKFINCLDPAHPKYKADGEKVLYHIYRGNDDQKAFEEAVDTFGANYDTIAYLFYIKNPGRYLPIRSSLFEASFQRLGLSFKTSGLCNWDNYSEYNGLIAEIRDEMQRAALVEYPEEVRLIDAHSFLWIIQEKRFDDWVNKYGSELEIRLERLPKKYSTQSFAYARSEEVKKETKIRAQGMCQLCGNVAPFKGKDGEAYLEVHHVIWLSRGGSDSLDNTVALCPNCHARMHILDAQEDVAQLKRCING